VRIVDVNEFYSPTGGGVRSYIDRKLAVMATLGHELIVIAPGREDRVEYRAGKGRVIVEGFIKFDYEISMGVRKGEDAFKSELEGILDRRRAAIRKILDEFGVPIVAAAETSKE